MNKTYSVIGLMSGTSMDGVDLAWVVFEPNGDNWQFTIKAAETIPYSDQWLARLIHLPDQTAEVFAMANVFYGKYLGQLIQQFIQKHGAEVDLIASHGQTIFHNPQKGYTIQIGSGAEIAAATGIPTVCDLRSSDVALGGQGAPIVPLGEKELFPEYKSFINIGGITNISFHAKEIIVGYDVCMGNLLLDYFAEQKGLPYDAGGEMARTGALLTDVLAQLNEQDYFQQPAPKSLDAKETVMTSLELMGNAEYNIPDLLHTLVAHISDQISLVLNKSSVSQVMVTGGGALNTYLMEQLQEKSKAEIVIPDPQIIDSKEALIMAFLGLKRYLNLANVLSSVTGASRDSINGAVYL